MLPIDYEELPPGEVQRLKEWFADPAYGTLKDVIQAQLVEKAEAVILMVADGDSKEAVKIEAREVRMLQELLDLLGDVAQGYHGADEHHPFNYRRMKAKL